MRPPAIEYVAVGSQEFQFTTALNYPKDELTGWEFEVRHAFDGAVEGLGVGANATLIDSEVDLTPFKIEQFALPGVAVDITSREMTNAPEHLFNLYTTYDLERTGTNLALFYTVQGDTLVEGAGIDNGNFVPSVFQNEYDTLNFSASQDLGDGLRLPFRAQHLTKDSTYARWAASRRFRAATLPQSLVYVALGFGRVPVSASQTSMANGMRFTVRATPSFVNRR